MVKKKQLKERKGHLKSQNNRVIKKSCLQGIDFFLKLRYLCIVEFLNAYTLKYIK